MNEKITNIKIEITKEEGYINILKNSSIEEKKRKR